MQTIGNATCLLNQTLLHDFDVSPFSSLGPGWFALAIRILRIEIGKLIFVALLPFMLQRR
jgi:hypothetical protein